VSLHLCECRRPIIYRAPRSGKIRADAAHDLCDRCFRDQLNRQRWKGARVDKRSGGYRAYPKHYAHNPRAVYSGPLDEGEDDGNGSPV
jgi:hypothetical protein